MNKLDEYISNETQRQFDDAKREIIESSRLGYSVMSPATQAAYEQAKRKNLTVASCINCGNAYPEKNSRQEIMLCPQCSGARAAITIYMKNHKIHTLSPQDFVKIANSKTTRFGRNNPK
jgi:hypothetical protein